MALQVVACLLATDRRAGQPRAKPLTRRLVLNPQYEETLILDFQAGAYQVKTVRLEAGAIGVDISVDDLLKALGAKTQ